MTRTCSFVEVSDIFSIPVMTNYTMETDVGICTHIRIQAKLNKSNATLCIVLKLS